MEAPADPAAAVFEPTGELFKDYCAYCETADREERDDLLDGISLVDTVESPRNAETPHNVHTKLFARGLDTPLFRSDISPLTNAIPHCANLYTAKFYGCSLSLDSYKLLVEAVFKSPSLISVAVEFNQTQLGRDPTTTKKERHQEHYVWAHQARGGGRYDTKPSIDKKAPAKDAKTPAGTKPGDVPPEQSPVKVPDGWHAMLLSGIHDLSFRGNGITDKQTKLIASALETNTELLSLNLWGNVISDEGASALAEALQFNTKLTSLNLGDNRLTDSCVITLVSCMRQTDINLADFPEHRSRVRDYQELCAPGTMTAEAPVYSTYTELFSASLNAEVKEVKKPPPKGKGGKDAVPTNAGLHPWDKACVRVGECVRVPGNGSLWSLNVANNGAVTEEGLRLVLDILKQGPTPLEELAPIPAAVPVEPVLDDKKGKDSKRKSMQHEASTESLVKDPAPAVAQTLSRFLVGHPSMPLGIVNEIDEIITSYAKPPAPLIAEE